MTTQPLPPGSRGPGEQFRSDPRMVVDVPRLWAGGVSTAVVAGLVAWVGVLIAGDILDFKISKAAVILSVFDSFTGNYVLTGVLLALAGTGLAHALRQHAPAGGVLRLDRRAAHPGQRRDPLHAWRHDDRQGLRGRHQPRHRYRHRLADLRRHGAHRHRPRHARTSSPLTRAD